jgi:release factor glutamine methyltransferase
VTPQGDQPGLHAVSDGLVTWRALLAETAAIVGDPVHARWLCEVAASADAAELTAMLDEPATERTVAHLDAMVARLRSGEPLQYVLGRWGFRHLDVAVDRRALIPRPETELVAAAAIDLARGFGPARTVVDLGAGTGVIGLAAAGELPLEGTTVWLTDVSEPALELARANLAGLGRAGANVRIGAGSWFDALPHGVVADVVVCNPPYVAEGSREVDSSVTEWEPAIAVFAGTGGLDAIVEIVGAARRRIRPGGALVLEIGADQGRAVGELLDAEGFVDVEVRVDLAGRDRIGIGRCPTTILESGDLRVRHLVNRPEDYGLLHRWLTTPEVLEWYEGRDRVFELADIVAEYGPGSDLAAEGVEPAIVELDGVPVGYVQLYELALFADEFGLADGRGVWSLDLFVGEPSLHGSGLGRRLVRAVAEHLRHERGARDVVIMPYPENERAVRAYEAAGFVRDAVVPEHEVHEGVMRDGLRMVYRPR